MGLFDVFSGPPITVSKIQVAVVSYQSLSSMMHHARRAASTASSMRVAWSLAPRSAPRNPSHLVLLAQ